MLNELEVSKISESLEQGLFTEEVLGSKESAELLELFSNTGACNSQISRVISLVSSLVIGHKIPITTIMISLFACFFHAGIKYGYEKGQRDMMEAMIGGKGND